jgi:hypothetical protein
VKENVRKIAVLIFLYASSNLLAAFVLGIFLIFGYSMLSLIWAIPIWILAVVFCFNKLDFLNQHSVAIGVSAGLLPALWVMLWASNFNFNPADGIVLFSIVVLPTTFISVGSALTATKFVFRNKRSLDL